MRFEKSVISILFFSFLIPLMSNIHSQEITLIILSNVELVTVNETSAAITWVTNLPTDTVVQWGTDDQLDSEIII